MDSSLRSKLRLSLFYFVLVAAIGTLLRLMFVIDTGSINYQYILHSHSHTAILGWVYNALYLALIFAYLPNQINSKKYNIIFWLTQISIIGMLITFSVQGYAAFSISFSTLHILMSYIFIYAFFKDTRKDLNLRGLISLKFIYGALFFLIISSFGPWGLAVIISKGLAETDLYKQAIYFYLHFQYNGWFIFALIGLWLWLIEKQIDENQKKNLTKAFYILFISNLPAYFLSLLGFGLSKVFWLIALASALGQVVGARYLYKVFFRAEDKIFPDSGSWDKKLFRLSFLLLFLKYLLQLISVLPGIGEPAFISREVAIAYIHLIMLGVISLGLLGWLSYNKMIILNAAGLKIFLTGLITTEILLFYPSFVVWFRAPAIPGYYIALLTLTLVMLIGVLQIFLSNMRKSSDSANLL